MKWRNGFCMMMAVLLLAQLTACGAEETTDTTDIQAEAADTETAAETQVSQPEIFTKGLDFGGENVTFLYRTDNVSEFYVKEATGDIVDDALYASRLQVEEGLNVRIEVLDRIGTSPADRTEYINHVANTVLAGDSVYDWVDAMSANFHLLIQQGVLADLGENPYIDFDKEAPLPHQTAQSLFPHWMYRHLPVPVCNRCPAHGMYPDTHPHDHFPLRR